MAGEESITSEEGLQTEASFLQAKLGQRLDDHIASQLPSCKMPPAFLKSIGYPNSSWGDLPPGISARVIIRKIHGFKAATHLPMPPPPPARCEDPCWASSPKLEGLQILVEETREGLRSIEALITAKRYKGQAGADLLEKANEILATHESDLRVAAYEEWKAAVAAQVAASLAYTTEFNDLVYKGLEAASARMLLWQREVGK